MCCVLLAVISKFSIGLTRNDQQLKTVRLLFCLSFCQRTQVFRVTLNKYSTVYAVAYREDVGKQ
jgi:hypothetical protein